MQLGLSRAQPLLFSLADVDNLARPLQAALVSAITFSCGAGIPLLGAAFVTDWKVRQQGGAWPASLSSLWPLSQASLPLLHPLVSVWSCTLCRHAQASSLRAPPWAWRALAVWRHGGRALGVKFEWRA